MQLVPERVPGPACLVRGGQPTTASVPAVSRPGCLRGLVLLDCKPGRNMCPTCRVSPDGRLSCHTHHVCLGVSQDCHSGSGVGPESARPRDAGAVDLGPHSPGRALG